MDLSRQMILLNGEPKSQQIDSIEKNETNGYCVRFKRNNKSYNYGSDKVVWLSDPESKAPTHCKVYIGGTHQYNVTEIWKFTNGDDIYWRIVYANGYVQEGDGTKIVISESCLDEKTSSDTLAYLKDVAFINPLGKNDKEEDNVNEETNSKREEDSKENRDVNDGILYKMYADISFIDADTAAACFLNPDKHKPKKLKHGSLIYPFGCNASQKKAVAAAFEHQMSVIQGPPGTGKTQTILNIIANIVCQGKTVMVVSNNNSATANVLEKVDKYGISFTVAPLGKRENKEAFIANQPLVPSACNTWGVTYPDLEDCRQQLHSTLQQLDKVYALQNQQAELLQEHQAVLLEWKHFCMDNSVDENIELKHPVSAKRIISVWLEFQAYANGEISEPKNLFAKWKEKIKWWWMKWKCKRQLHIKSRISKNNLTPLIQELQTLYYLNRKEELNLQIESIENSLTLYDAQKLSDALTSLSVKMLRASLHDHYATHERTPLDSIKDMWSRSDEMMQQYPVVLSTTFSARTCVFADKLYDYIIIDEASQVAIDTGALALTCAKNAIVVGDTLQLPNVVTNEDRMKLNDVMKQYNISAGYDCAKNSFLQSVLEVVTDIPETLLREHYRCHPRIINFCNQKFYGGSLVIMTEDKGEENVLSAIRTVKGNHATEGHYNQREIDVMKKEVMPTLKAYNSIGIVTPYNNQVDACNRQIPAATAGTIHKYQGRENDAIIMSVVDNQISDFADDTNMLNVAISRAKKKFCLVMTGNDQEKHGNIMDLLDYIDYNNCTVTDSKLASIFDYLYEQYTEQLLAFVKSHPRVSRYASENLTYAMINDIIASDQRFKALKVVCHVPLRQVVKDTSMMNEDELKYAANYNTHIDFLIINRVGKQPVMAIETDGYSFHNNETEQHRRDLMKDHILSSYHLPLLRLSTKGSDEKEKLSTMLEKLI